jgi:hypothetical protein
MAQPYTHHIFSIMAQHNKYGYQRGGFNIDLSRHQLELLRQTCFRGKSIRQLLSSLPLLTNEQCVAIGRVLNISSLMSLKHMEYFLDCGGISPEYFQTITIQHEGERMLSTIAAYTSISHAFSHASVITAEIAALLNLSDEDFINRRKLSSEEIQQASHIRDGNSRYKFDRNRFAYLAQSMECTEYLFPVRDYDA